MRNLILATIFFGIAVYLGSLMFDKFSSDGFLKGDKREVGPPVTESAQAYYYPANLELMAKTGRALEVSLVGRSESKIQFIRVEDREMFIYPISDLVENSQQMVLKYPVTGLKDADKYLNKGAVTLNDIYVEQLHERIRKIDEEIEMLTKQYRVSQSSAEKRKIKNEVFDLREERIECESKISERLTVQS